MQKRATDDAATDNADDYDNESKPKSHRNDNDDDDVVAKVAGDDFASRFCEVHTNFCLVAEAQVGRRQ